MAETAIFKASKRRKIPKVSLNESDLELAQSQRDTERQDRKNGSTEVNSDEDTHLETNSLASLIRARKQIRNRGGGVQFSNTKPERLSDVDENHAEVKVDPAMDRLMEISNRFVAKSGQVVNVDQHMMAYIDTELAKRRIGSPLPSISRQDQEETPSSSHPDLQDVHTTSSMANTDGVHHPFHGSLIQLREVDLGPSAHTLNQARTQAAVARAQTGQQIVPEELKPRKPRRPRIGRNGKVIKPRARKSRPSEDIARDALVEQILHEHGLDIYDKAPTTLQTSKPVTTSSNEEKVITGGSLNPASVSALDSQNQPEAEPETDELLARQFREEFFDAMADRKQHKNKGPSGGTSGAKQSKAPGSAAVERGPKLGGSRSARAKMVQARKQEKEGQK